MVKGTKELLIMGFICVYDDILVHCPHQRRFRMMFSLFGLSSSVLMLEIFDFFNEYCHLPPFVLWYFFGFCLLACLFASCQSDSDSNHTMVYLYPISSQWVIVVTCGVIIAFVFCVSKKSRVKRMKEMVVRQNEKKERMPKMPFPRRMSEYNK